jgi:GDP-4-dehydro-6-deoxy-D-mannose reductase
MRKFLITGVSGFVGRHFLECLEEEGVATEVLGLSRNQPRSPLPSFRYLRSTFVQLDMLDKERLYDAIYQFQPSHILHLASYSSVGFSWQKPVESFRNNTNVLLNLLEQVRELELPCRILSVGSSEQYGNVAVSDLPLREDMPLQPVSPYGVARVAQEQLSSVYVRGYGLDIVMTRSFNHIGTHQREAFVIPSLAKQLTDIRRGIAPSRLSTGNRAIVRDFVDVRDVVRAYMRLLMEGTAGEVYNVCTGVGTSIEEVIGTMQSILGTAATLTTDPKLVRPDDNSAIVGSHAKLKSAVGWQPRHSLQESLRSILAWWDSGT